MSNQKIFAQMSLITEELFILSTGSACNSEDEFSPEWEEISPPDKQLQEYDTDFCTSPVTLASAAVFSPLSEAADTAETKQSPQLSAEIVAKSLLEKFSDRKHPAASELQWLVSFQDAPQCLLPLPETVAVAPDDILQVEAVTKKPLCKQDSLPVSSNMTVYDHTFSNPLLTGQL